MKTFAFVIHTPEGEFYTSMIQTLHLTTGNGEITVLPDHFPLLSNIVPCEASFVEHQVRHNLFLSSGILLIEEERVKCIVDAAEFQDQIDIVRAREAEKRARNRLQKQDDKVDIARAEAALKRSLLRQKIASK